jgi:hypothetical protein
MYYIGLDVHKRTISYCVKDAAGQVHQEGKIGSTRRELDPWIKTSRPFPNPGRSPWKRRSMNYGQRTSKRAPSTRSWRLGQDHLSNQPGPFGSRRNTPALLPANLYVPGASHGVELDWHTGDTFCVLLHEPVQLEPPPPRAPPRTNCFHG